MLKIHYNDALLIQKNNKHVSIITLKILYSLFKKLYSSIKYYNICTNSMLFVQMLYSLLELLFIV